MVGELCAVAGLSPLHSPRPALQDPHTCGAPTEAAGGGEAIPCPGSSASHATSTGHCRSSPQACAGWWQVEGVLPGQSRVCVHDAPAWQWEIAAALSLASRVALLSAVVRSGHSQDPAPSGASLCLPARSLPLALAWAGSEV